MRLKNWKESIMIIVDSNGKPVFMDNIFSPTTTTDFWVLDLELVDFTLSPLSILEERTCPSLLIKTNDTSFIIPANWNILVYEPETMQLDVVTASDIAGCEFMGFGYGINKRLPSPIKLSVMEYYPNFTNVNPLLNKHQMLCHSISQDMWICISPFDVYSKYLKEISAGDLM